MTTHSQQKRINLPADGLDQIATLRRVLGNHNIGVASYATKKTLVLKLARAGITVYTSDNQNLTEIYSGFNRV